MSQTTRPTTVPARFARITHLGPPLGIFPAGDKPWQRRAFWLLAGIGLGGAAVLGVLAGYFGILRYQKYGPAMVWNSLQPLVLGALVLFAVGALSGWRAVSARRDCAVLYSGGVALDSPLGMTFCRWDEIASLKSLVTRRYLSGIFSGVTRACTITLHKGERIVLSDRLERAGSLIQAVRECSFPLLYARLAQAFDSGSVLRFGAMTIQRDSGITYRRANILWEQIAALEVSGGQLKVRLKTNRVVRIPAQRITNLDVLLVILDQVVRVAR